MKVGSWAGIITSRTNRTISAGCWARGAVARRRRGPRGAGSDRGRPRAAAALDGSAEARRFVRGRDARGRLPPPRPQTGPGPAHQADRQPQPGRPRRPQRARHARPDLKRRAADVLAYSGRPGTSNGPTEAINGRLENPRGSALGFRDLTNYIVRSLLEDGGFRPQLHPRL